LFRQWQAWGITPDLLLGHSVGEISAAHVAGVLSLEDAAALVCARARSMHDKAISGGRMAAVAASEQEVRQAIAELPDPLRSGVDVAALNTPTQTVVSGDVASVDALLTRFEAIGRKISRLVVSHAFHSSHMDGMLDHFHVLAERLTYHSPSLS